VSGRAALTIKIIEEVMILMVRRTASVDEGLRGCWLQRPTWRIWSGRARSAVVVRPCRDARTMTAATVNISCGAIMDYW
jgi:hypothetical protein